MGKDVAKALGTKTKKQLVLELEAQYRRVEQLEKARDRRAGGKAETRRERTCSDLVESVNDLIQIVDAAGTVIFANRAWMETLGYSEKDIGKMKLADFVRSDEVAHITEMLRGACRGEAPGRIETVFVGKDGREIQVEGDLNAWRRDGQLTAVCGIFRDVGARKEAEAALREQVEAMCRVGRSMSRTRDVVDLLGTVLETTMDVLHLDKGCVLLVERETNGLLLKAHRGMSAGFLSSVKEMKLGDGLAGRAARSKKPVVVREVSRRVGIDAPVFEREGVRSMALIPILAKDSLVGVMCFGSVASRPFDDEEVRLLEAIASQVGVAAESSRVFEESMQIAFTDGLTGLYNRRFLMEQIEREFARVERSKGSFSMIMLDLDGLKRINDRYGHHEGDAFLKELGRIIRKSTRASDVAARWGGDEFMVLAPDTSSERASVIGERIRLRVEHYRPVVEGEEVCASVSVGIASYPSHASEVTELLRRADEAMYCAKKGGKNQVCVFRS
jgi:diguanylate cyclase (GGDEF)-like protein/PAS domain S-box-containing protein